MTNGCPVDKAVQYLIADIEERLAALKEIGKVQRCEVDKLRREVTYLKKENEILRRVLG